MITTGAAGTWGTVRAARGFGGAEVAADTCGGKSAATGAQSAIALSGRRSPDEERLIIETDTRHGAVSAGMPASHKLVAAGTEVPRHHPEWSDCRGRTLASSSA